MRRILKIALPLIGPLGLIKYIFFGIFSGLSSFLFIGAVTRVLGLISKGSFNEISTEYILIFASIILFIIWLRKVFLTSIISLSQSIFWKLRKDILAILLKANYQQLLKRKVVVHSVILGDIYVLTDASMSIIGFCTSVILSISCMVYLASISIILFFITLIVALLGVTVYYFGSKKNNKDFEKARHLEQKFVINLDTILDGFKEIFMEPKIGQAIYEQRIKLIARDSADNNITAQTGYLNNQITGQVLFYLLITSILLVFSIYLRIQPSETVSFVFTLLYLLSSIETIMVLLPGLMRASVAANHLIELKTELEKADFNNPVSEKYVLKDDFNQISINNLEFIYKRNVDEPFRIGPINFEINKGEVIFIYGSNGSGKTTFMNTFLGLYMPQNGEIRLNNILIDEDNYPNYRTTFSVVFNDFYMFDELLGMEEVNMGKWLEYVDMFELNGKVELNGKILSTTDLSAGQRKRLALIIALLDEKPLIVLDEWAADQDPYFRKKFYTEIIPKLKIEGFTILAITHDDKYYHCADKLYRMDFGNIIRENIDLFRIDNMPRAI